ncbi:LEF-5 [Callinectes sapidus nudivirus]|nr:LEF-5 [Callinectes sapidus nudivirus]
MSFEDCSELEITNETPNKEFDDDYESYEEDSNDDDSKDEAEYEDCSPTKQKSITPNKKCQQISLTKLNVIYGDSPHVGMNIQKGPDTVNVRFTNIICAAPNIPGSGINENLTPCPAVDSSKVYKCIHDFTVENKKTRSGDEIFTIIYYCKKCGFTRYT